MDESAGVTRAWAAKRPRPKIEDGKKKRRRFTFEEDDGGEDWEKNTIIHRLPADMILHILSLLSTTESWSLSRCSKKFYEMVNPFIYPLFKQVFDKRLFEICPSSPFDFIPKKYFKDYAFAGSLVWSTLLGKRHGEWGIQDMDIFYESNYSVADIIREENFARTQYGEYKKSVTVGEDTYDLYPVEYIAHGIASVGDCIHVMRKDKSLEWGYVKCIDFVDAGNLSSGIADFDIVGCRSNLRGGVLTIPSPAETLFGRSRGKPDNEGRKHKYGVDRGIIFISG